MGREIRRVPPNWEHPKEQKYERNWRTGLFEESEEYKPMFDRSFEERAQEWLDGVILWFKGEYSYQLDDESAARTFPKTFRGYIDWVGNFPDLDYYRPEWTKEECTAYQIYETVSEGTPISPVFQTEQEMIDWLIEQGHSLNAATEFVKHQWAPSMVMITKPGGGGVFANDIDSYDVMVKKETNP